MRQVGLVVLGIVLVFGVAFEYPSIVVASCTDPNQQSCSANYGVNETFFGSGGQLCVPGSTGNSTNYCAKASVGELTVGSTLGTLYKAQAGFTTNREPSLAVLINDSQCTAVHPSTAGSSFNLGTLSTSSVSHVTGNFSVMSYLAHGYVVQTSGASPTYTSGVVTHHFTTLSNGAPTAGTEDFGMNLVANTGFGGFGFGVSQLPDTTFGFGQAAPSSANGGLRGYNTADTYSYHDGDEIATSSSSSGVTCYFPSYVYAISNVTPGGTYTFNQSIVVTSTF